MSALLDPAGTASWNGRDWTLALHQARFTGLVGRMADGLLLDSKLPGDICPRAVRGHLEAALRVCRAQRAEVSREARFLDQALANLGAPVILLKGAAYAAADLPAARGRVFSDMDILVPKVALAKAESLLAVHGWMTTEESEYNQQYYRQWMHELPPLRHLQRGTVLDVHHTILPETARLRPDAAKLIEAAVPLPTTRVLHVLSPVDMLLHSMTHLFMNDDMTHGLRDLSDLDLLLRGPYGQDSIWARLLPRARELNLQRPLFYALRCLRRITDLPIPEKLLAAAAEDGPGQPLGRTMDWIWSQALFPPAPSKSKAGRDLALAALYVRGHWLRMPPPMLFKHLAIKALGMHKDKRSSDRSTDRAQGANF